MLDYPIPSLLSNPICTNFSFLCIAYQLHKTGMPIPETDGRSDFDSNGGCIPDLVWEQSGRESVPAVAGVVYRIWARRIAGARPGRTVESVSWGGCEGGHKAGPYRELTGLKERSVANPSRAGTCSNMDTRSARHVVGEGALRGRSPRTREGRIGPTAQKCSGQWSVVRDGAYSGGNWNGN